MVAQECRLCTHRVKVMVLWMITSRLFSVEGRDGKRLEESVALGGQRSHSTPYSVGTKFLRLSSWIDPPRGIHVESYLQLEKDGVFLRRMWEENGSIGGRLLL